MVRYRYGAALALLLGGIAFAQSYVVTGSGTPSGTCEGPRIWISRTNPSTQVCCFGGTWTDCPPVPVASTASTTGGVRTISVAAGNYLNSTVSAANITGMAFPVLANTAYGFQCTVSHTGTLTAGPRFGLAGPASPTAVSVQWEVAKDNTNTLFSHDVAFSNAAQTNAITTAHTAPIITEARGVIINGANAGTVSLHVTSSAAGNEIKILGGSHCDVRP